MTKYVLKGTYTISKPVRIEYYKWWQLWKFPKIIYEDKPKPRKKEK